MCRVLKRMSVSQFSYLQVKIETHCPLHLKRFHRKLPQLASHSSAPKIIEKKKQSQVLFLETGVRGGDSGAEPPAVGYPNYGSETEEKLPKI